MGLQFRLVPPGHEPPRRPDGQVQPQLDMSYRRAIEEHELNERLWSVGRHPDQFRFPDHGCATYEAWAGQPGDPAYYRPDWPAGAASAIRLYENVTEGTPRGDELPNEAAAIAWIEAEWGITAAQAELRLVRDLVKSAEGPLLDAYFRRLLRLEPAGAVLRLQVMLDALDLRLTTLSSDILAEVLLHVAMDDRLLIITNLRTLRAAPPAHNPTAPPQQRNPTR